MKGCDKIVEHLLQLKPLYVVASLLTTRGHTHVDDTVLMSRDRSTCLVVLLCPTKGTLCCVLWQGYDAPTWQDMALLHGKVCEMMSFSERFRFAGYCDITDRSSHLAAFSLSCKLGRANLYD